MEEIKNVEVKENAQEEEAKLELELSIKLMSDGQIRLDINKEDTRIEVVEDILKRTYENINEQKIIQKALDAFKQKLSQ